MKNHTAVAKRTKQFAREMGHPEKMPTEDDMLEHGESSLAIAITKFHKGFPKFAKRIGLQPRRQPNNRFQERDAVCRELRRIAARKGTPREMPTTGFLRLRKHFTLIAAIASHGGVRVVAAAAGLKLTHDKKEDGHYDDFARVRDGVLEFITKTKTLGIMPSHGDLCAASCSGLSAAITKHGGFPLAAIRLGLPPRRKTIGHWTPQTIEAEALLFIAAHGEPGVFPTSKLLRRCDRTDLENALLDYPGGARQLASKLGLAMLGGRPNGYWEDRRNIARELRKFISEHGQRGMMPTQALLLQHGRQDIVNALYRWAGGQTAFAESLGLKTSERPKNYWKSFDNLRLELIQFNQAHGTPGQMPSATWLIENNHTAIQNAMNQYHGGTFEVARRLGWSCMTVSLWPRSEIELVIAHELQAVADFSIDHPSIKTRKHNWNCDIVIPYANLIVEFDSYRWHHGVTRKGVKRAVADRRKSDDLRRAGWTVIRIREQPLGKTHPHDVLVTGKSGTKAIVDAAVIQMNRLCRLDKGRVDQYLASTKLMRKQQSKRYIRRILSERGG